jgi:hypothetical protein
VQESAKQCRNVQDSTGQCKTAQDSAGLCRTVQDKTMQDSAGNAVSAGQCSSQSSFGDNFRSAPRATVYVHCTGIGC